MRVEVITFGCRFNARESDVIQNEARIANLQDAVIFNTCAVTGEATRQARQAIRRIRRKRPDTKIIVTGCAAQIEPDDFAQMTEVDFVIGNEEKLHEHTYRALQEDPLFGEERKIVTDGIASAQTMTTTRIAPPPAERSRAVLQIQNGCDHSCTFCIIPRGRGSSRSAPVDHVVKEAQTLVAQGHGELILSGVDIASYGQDLLEKPTLGALILEILRKTPDLKRLRLSSIDSIEADDLLLRAFAEEERLMPHLHLSLQSGDDLILRRMKRRHCHRDAVHFCANMRSRRPDITFGADLIAGFPTETDRMFAHSLAAIDDCGLTFLHIFPFSPRPGTPAARMPQVDRAIIKMRAAALRKKGQKALSQHLDAQLGSTHELLLERSSTGRTPHNTPVMLDKRKTVHLIPGTIVKAKIMGHTDTVLLGKVMA